MATEAEVDDLIRTAPAEAIFIWRSVQGIDDARDRAAAQSRTDLEFQSPFILRDVPTFVAELEGRPIKAVVLDPFAILTDRQQNGLAELRAYIEADSFGGET